MADLQDALKVTIVTIGASETAHVLDDNCVGFRCVTDSADAELAFASTGAHIDLFETGEFDLLLSRPLYGLRGGKSLYFDGTQNNTVAVIENIGLF